MIWEESQRDWIKMGIQPYLVGEKKRKNPEMNKRDSQKIDNKMARNDEEIQK